MFNQHLGNIFQVYARADRWDRSNGMESYVRYHQILSELADDRFVESPKAYAIFAALSPNSDYASNMLGTIRMMDAYHSGSKLDSFSVNTYSNNKRKAWAICNAWKRPLEVLLAPKTRSFYLNILDPFDPKPVTIDGHMLGVWRLKRTTLKYGYVKITDQLYTEIAEDFRTVARVLGILPNQLQAICWLTWKRIHGILSDSQMNLFEEPDAIQGPGSKQAIHHKVEQK